jgi:hypothetical protein
MNVVNLLLRLQNTCQGVRHAYGVVTRGTLHGVAAAAAATDACQLHLQVSRCIAGESQNVLAGAVTGETGG